MLGCYSECEGWARERQNDPQSEPIVPVFETELPNFDSGAGHFLEPEVEETV